MVDPDRPVDLRPLERWLLDAPHVDDDGSAFARGLAEGLVAAGLPVWRASHALMTKHPEVLWRTVQWRAGGAVVVRDQAHARLDDPYYTRSAVAVVRSRLEPVRVRLAPGPLPYPICEELRDEGGTDYVVVPLPFTNGAVSYLSLATRDSAGFSEDAIAAVDGLRPSLARRLELESSYYATRALLDVYLGKNAARRVFAGAFQRGKGELIDAAIWFSDMRGFTALSDRTPPAVVVETLDVVFDAITAAVGAHGGEVLKFIGDAVLAIFPEGDDPRAACRQALAAADEALASLARRSEGRDPPLAIGVALHRGRVMYGNVGARDWLDFTVISSAVNEASRLELLSKSLGVSLVLSEAFVATAAIDDAIDLGEHALKGVAAKLRVYSRRT